MKKVLLTGGRGFIGRQAIFSLLRRGYEVHAVSRSLPVPDTGGNGVIWHQCDLLDTEQQQVLLRDITPSHLLHLAWYTEQGKYWSAWDNLRWVQASLELLLSFREYGGTRAVFCGSCMEYDWSHGFCSEGVTPIKPATLYGCCKNSLQEILTHFSGENELSSAWGRVFFLYGPHEHSRRLVASVIRALLTGETANCTHGQQIRDFLYVKDVADALAALLDSTVEGPVNIASGEPIRLRQIIFQIAEKVGWPAKVNFGALPVHHNDPPLVVGDIRRLSSEVGWRPRYDLAAGLEETISWWRQYLSTGGSDEASNNLSGV